jgi:DNA invertase Pin-like site-specific DNA recombinase
MFQPSVPLRPKNPDGKLRVIVIGRISTELQDAENINASYRYVEEHLARIYDGPTVIEYLGERASGMLADRTTIRRAEELIARGQVDVVIAEDLSRIYRNPRLQYVFVQNSVDSGCRVVCIADNLDTGTDHWEVMLGAAAFRHGLFIPDVRRRVRRTATHAFHNGGMVLMVRYGYRRLSKEEATSGHFGPKGLRIAKVPECTETIQQMCCWVHDGVSYVRIAEQLNQAGIRPGPYAKQDRWTAANIVNLLRDPILSGTRRFRVIQYEPVFETGKHRRRKGGQPEIKVYPELAHFSVAEQQHLLCVMNERAALWRVSTDRVSKRLNVARCKSLWPGQAATCGICGGRMYEMGQFVKCQNALPGAAQPCWNHVQAPVELTRQKIVAWLIEETLSLPGARESLVDCVRSELERLHRGTQSDGCRLDRRVGELQAAATNLAKAIAKGGELDVLLQELAAIQAEMRQLEAQKRQPTEAESRDSCRLTREQIGSDLKNLLLAQLRTSYEFADTFRRWITEFRIVPVQALDTPFVRPRARLTVNFGRLRDGPAEGSGEQAVSTVIDLFEPPEHIRWLNSCIGLKAENPKHSLKRIALQLGIGHMTVKRALGYARLMTAAGMTEPYRELTERPEVASRWHPKRRAD